MQRKIPVTVRIVLVSLLLVSCVTAGRGHRGQVLDIDTQQPIPGALVSLYQSGNEFGSIIAHGGSIGVCFHSALTMTDSEGRFSLPRWHVSRRYIGRHTVLFAYKPGYLVNTTPGKTRSGYLGNARIAKLKKWDQQKKLDPIEYLRRDPNVTRAPTDPGRGPESLRVHYLYGKIIRDFACGIGKTRYPLYKAVYHEAARLALTDKDREYVRRICNKATGKDIHYHLGSRGKGTACNVIADVPEAWRAWDAEVNALGQKE